MFPASRSDPLPSPFGDWPRPLAFVLSGAGAFGSVQVGMLRALTERGVRPDLVVGTSAGALNGAMFAADPDTAHETLAALWSSTDRRRVFGGRRHRLVSLARYRTLSSGALLRDLIAAHVPAATFADLTIRFAAVATNTLTGEPELLDDGELIAALMASAAVPGVFPLVHIDGRSYCDGGVAANVPIRQAIAFGAKSVVSLDATPPIIASAPPRGLLASVTHSASLMLRSQRSHAVDELAHRYRIAVMPSATPADMGSFNFARTDGLLASSYATAVAALEDWAAAADSTRLAPGDDR